MLGRVLPEGNDVSIDVGFLPSTLGEDGDPLDNMVMLEAPAPMGVSH
jgi:inorganic pyrophosphatase